MPAPLTWDPGDEFLTWDSPLDLRWDGDAPPNPNPQPKTMNEMNRVSATLSAADITAIKNAIAAIRAKLPFLVSLSNDDRKQLPKMAEKSSGFDDKCAPTWPATRSSSPALSMWPR